MSLIGGGANVQGYHLITHFALHKYFVDRNRPTPKFLFLDQPSQVYFSNLQNLSLNEEEIERIKETGSIEAFSDQDREAVKRLFNFIFAVFHQSLATNFQIIITDHVNLLDSPSFQDALVEVWRDGMKLVPTEWLNMNG